jgi:predicted HAD superfamily Cof-like phosphohydrolase
MTNPFKDQTEFMNACDQTTESFNEDQFNLYTKLISEEVDELWSANSSGDKTECLDALVDILVVTIGAINSLGADAEGAWNEVMRTNMAKIDPITGKVRKREDGKVLKPEGWQPPELSKFLVKKWDHYSDLPSPEAYK